MSLCCGLHFAPVYLLGSPFEGLKEGLWGRLLLEDPRALEVTDIRFCGMGTEITA